MSVESKVVLFLGTFSEHNISIFSIINFLIQLAFHNILEVYNDFKSIIIFRIFIVKEFLISIFMITQYCQRSVHKQISYRYHCIIKNLDIKNSHTIKFQTIVMYS
jgi:hypothetical protein